ncbi:MAG: GGDEF domain-containing protein [Lachnospiraceae bacterium]|nr:GGDEF domain-containing protein [Lachnospiraceae bacterium]
MRRKRIALLTSQPYETCQKRLMQGIFRQCQKYDYDAVVIAQFAPACLAYESEFDGEKSIYEMMNFDRFDGIILDSLVLELGGDTRIVDTIRPMLKRSKTPVVCVNQPIDDYPAVMVDTGVAIERITEHLIGEHGCKNIYMVTGGAQDEVARARAEGYVRAMERHGLACGDDRIYYRYFWFNGGDDLVDDIVAGRVERPDAVVCASDQIAIGLIQKLKYYGINVPKDVLVTGYDNAPAGTVFEPNLTSYLPDDAFVGASAVQYLHNIIEDEKDTQEPDRVNGIIPGESCGCAVNTEHLRQQLEYLLMDRSIIMNARNPIDMMRYNTSYMQETLAGTETPEQCLQKLTEFVFLLDPLNEFYLCLNKDWLTIEDGRNKAPREMNAVLHSVSAYMPQDVRDTEYNELNGNHCFDAKLVLPQLDEEHCEPRVYYFLPVHYLNTALGYGVIICGIGDPPRPDFVINSWFRALNNTLNVVRMQYRLRQFSDYDAMTGLLNRRGMQNRLSQMLLRAKDGDKLFAASMDLDRLKYINDHFGHSEGDRSIREIAACINRVALPGELCVRMGGDEFLLIGVGDYEQSEVEGRLLRFREYVAEADRRVHDYTLMASAGYALTDAVNCDVSQIIDAADEEMYREKGQHRSKY